MTKNQSFEASLEELEKIVSALEAGNVPLDKAIEHYTKGVELQKLCQKKLDEAKLKVEKIQEKDGKIKTSLFEE